MYFINIALKFCFADYLDTLDDHPWACESFNMPRFSFLSAGTWYLSSSPGVQAADTQVFIREQ